MLQRIFLFLVIAVASPAVGAQTSATQQKDIDAALTLTGFDAAMDQLEIAYRRSLAVGEEGYQLSVTQREALAQALTSFNKAALKKKLTEQLLPQYQQRPMQTVLSLQQDQIAAKFRRYERIASSPQQQENREQYVATLDEHPFSETRLALVRALTEATHTAAIAALIQAQADVDIAVALDLASAEYISANDSQGVLLWQRTLEQNYLDQFKQFGDGYQIYTYRWINNDELRQHIEFLQDKNVQWFMETALQGLREVLQKQREQLVEEFTP